MLTLVCGHPHTCGASPLDLTGPLSDTHSPVGGGKKRGEMSESTMLHGDFAWSCMGCSKGRLADAQRT